MAAPRSSTAFAKTTGRTTSRKPPSSAANETASFRAAKPPLQPPTALSPSAPATSTAELLHELQTNADALSAQIARLADRFL